MEAITETVQYREIAGFPNYLVGDNGTVINFKTLEHTYTANRMSHAKLYTYVWLWNKGERKSFRVHRLVALAFVPNPNPALFTDVHHKDDNSLNNCASNLEWCTQSYNERQKRHGKE